MSLRNLLPCSALLLGCTFLAPLALANPIGYQYVFSGASPLNYEPVAGVSGYITLSATPVANQDYNATYSASMPDTLNPQYGPATPAIQLTDFSFTDGITTFTPQNSYVTGADLQTISGGAGAPFSYYMLEFDAKTDNNGLGPFLVLTNENGSYGTYSIEPTQFNSSQIYYDSYDSFGAAVPVVTPEPASWTLFGTGALLLIGLAWRRRDALA